MRVLNKNILKFLESQSCVLVSTLDAQTGMIHTSVKGIVGLEASGKIFIIDLYKARTYQNLLKNPAITITSFNEQLFVGFSLQGRARIVPRDKIKCHIKQKWEDKIISRISARMAKNIKAGYKAAGAFESALPRHPQYLIEIDVEQVMDLVPSKLK